MAVSKRRSGSKNHYQPPFITGAVRQKPVEKPESPAPVGTRTQRPRMAISGPEIQPAGPQRLAGRYSPALASSTERLHYIIAKFRQHPPFGRSGETGKVRDNGRVAMLEDIRLNAVGVGGNLFGFEPAKRGDVR